MIKETFSKVASFLSNDVGIDLGTANTLVYIKGAGIVVNEPTVVAINVKTGQILAIGRDAAAMIGRTPVHIEIVRPLSNGVISDFEAAQEYVSYFLRRAEEKTGRKLLRPRVVVGSPSGITNVERRAIRKAARHAGAREVMVLEEPLLAAIGVRLPVHDPVGSFVIDMGGGTTDIAVISLGGIYHSRHTTVAGDRLNEDIIDYVRDEYKVLIGERTAEYLKKTTASIEEPDEEIETVVQGRDLVSGLPREITITDHDIREAVKQSIRLLTREVVQVFEITPPEMSADVSKRGIVFTGGGALMRGLPEYLETKLEIPVMVPDDPLTSVVLGTSIVLEDPERFAAAFIHDDEIPLQI
jgi:rod shape-determining protein MreB